MTSSGVEMSTFTSPKRDPKLTIRIENGPGSPPFKDVMMLPWNWGAGAQKIQLSPSSSCGSPESEKESLRRGRPRAEVLTNLVLEGSKSPCQIKCKVCNRVFPREKSLQAHMRTHTGERPYVCDYPGCARAFCQSGQLKTHQRLHTGEKPFACSYEGCGSRFTHANRHCQFHPFAALKRGMSEVVMPEKDNLKEDVKEWFKKYVESRKAEASLSSPSSSHSGQQLKRLLQDSEQRSDIVVKRPTNRDLRQSLDDQKDKWLGALALIELAQSQ